MLSYAPILWIFLSLLFFSSWRAHFFLNSCPVFFYFSIRFVLSTNCTCVVRFTVLLYGGIFLIFFVDFYFTPYITTKHNNNNGTRHIMAWYDGMIDCNSIKNREGGKRNSSSSYDWQVPHQSHFSPPFCFVSLFLFFFLFYFVTAREGYRTIIDGNESIRYCGALQ